MQCRNSSKRLKVQCCLYYKKVKGQDETSMWDGLKVMCLIEYRFDVAGTFLEYCLYDTQYVVKVQQANPKYSFKKKRKKKRMVTLSYKNNNKK